MLLKDIPTWFSSAKPYWYAVVAPYPPEDLLREAVDTMLDALFAAYNSYYSGSLESQLVSRLNVQYSYILLTTGTSTVPECPPVLNPGMPDDPDLRLLYEAWRITDAPEDSTGLFVIGPAPPPPEPDPEEEPDPDAPPPPTSALSPTEEYTTLMSILTNGNATDSARVMYLVDHMPEAIFDKLTYLKNNQPIVITLLTGDEIEDLIKNGMYLSDINAYFGWSINKILDRS